MARIDWASVFDEVRPRPGASDAEVRRFASAVVQPLTPNEVEMIREDQRKHAGQMADVLTKLGVKSEAVFTDPSSWEMPRGELPPNFLDFLRWSNGGEFRTGDRWFWPAFGTEEVRTAMLSYEVPDGMPGALPFGFDGSGTFYLFDMRRPSHDGEYPVLVSHASCVSYAECRQFAKSFLDACRSRVDPMSLR